MESGTVSYQNCCTTMIHSALEVRDRNRIILAIAIQVSMAAPSPGVKPAFTCNLLEKKIMETWWVSIWCFNLQALLLLTKSSDQHCPASGVPSVWGHVRAPVNSTPRLQQIQNSRRFISSTYYNPRSEQDTVIPSSVEICYTCPKRHPPLWATTQRGGEARGGGGGGGGCSTATIIILINRIVVYTIECLSTPHPHKSLTAVSCQEVTE